MKHLYTLTRDEPRPSIKMPPGPFYDPTTMYNDDDPDGYVPGWISFTLFGAGLAFLAAICYGCWIVIHHGGAH